MNREALVAALHSVPDRGFELRGEKGWIKCPWHRDGNESTPSLCITLDSGQYPAGSWVCFGCSPRKSGNWNVLAVKLSLKKKGQEDEDELYASELPEKMLQKMLEEEDEQANNLHEMILKEPIVQISQNWRGIKGWLLNEIGARVSMLSSSGKTINSSRVYLPVRVNGKWQGGIFCSWSEQSGLKYENEKMESQNLLFPYDWVKEQLLKLPPKRRKCLFVEGPRDALNMCQNGIMALANLGGDTVWSESKSELLQELNLSVLVIATDPDHMGNKLANIIKRSLGNIIPNIKRFKMKVKWNEARTKILEKEDPGNLSPDRIDYLRKQMEGFS
jgi:5S rRNA maturation endonuclease (ribonuclease M5)